MLVPITIELLADVPDPAGIRDCFADLLQEMSELLRVNRFNNEEDVISLTGGEGRYSIDWDFAEEMAFDE